MNGNGDEEGFWNESGRSALLFRDFVDGSLGWMEQLSRLIIVFVYDIRCVIIFNVI